MASNSNSADAQSATARWFDLDRWIPPAFDGADLETRRRARLTILAILVANISTLLISAMLLYLNNPLTAAAVLWTLLFHSSIYLIMAWSGSVTLAGHCFMWLIFLEITWDYGQVDGYAVLATIMLPLGASALIGPRGAVWWTIVGFLWAGILGPFVLRPDYFQVPLSLSAACMTVVIGIASIAIERNRAGAALQAASAAERLRLRERAMHNFIETTFPAYVEVEPDGQMRASPEAAALVGNTVDGLKDQHLLDLVHPEDAERALATYKNAPNGFRDELRLKRSDGSWVWVEAFGAPLRFAEKAAETSPWVFVARSIDEERRHQENWQRAQRLEGVGVLAAGVAHDFNNLLTVIRGFTEMMPHSEERQSVLAAADKAAELTSSLMRFGRVAPKTSGAVDVVAAVRKWLPMFNSLLGEDCELKLQLGVGPHLADMSESQLNQVLLNLVTNAKEAMRAGDELYIRVTEEGMGQDTAQLRGTAAGRFIRIDVRDTGAGMTRAVQEHAFDPFFTTKDMSEGSGLGLASVYGIVQQQNGAIDLDSTPGVGTTISIWLPVGVLAATSLGTIGNAEVVTGDARSRNVLLVEDNDELRTWASRALEHQGYHVTATGSGHDALVKMERARPDLLITDIVMSGMRGTELAELARARYPDLSILFVSGYADQVVNDWRQVASDNASFLAKPFGAAELAQAVQNLLSTHELAPQGT